MAGTPEAVTRTPEAVTHTHVLLFKPLDLANSVQETENMFSCVRRNSQQRRAVGQCPSLPTCQGTKLAKEKGCTSGLALSKLFETRLTIYT